MPLVGGCADGLDSVTLPDSNQAWYAARANLYRAAAFEDARQSCPWCGSHDLTAHLLTTDLLQLKPGAFRLDRCGHCGHIFQNPRLNAEGLEYYYRDFYDGLNFSKMKKAMRRKRATYRKRASALLLFTTTPATWLDVGAAHGHFCETARNVFPGAVFHGLDASGSLAEAVVQGRLDRAFQMELPALLNSPQRAIGYDVISMFHVLEHVAEPRIYLECAMQLLKPGGLMVMEVPNPACPMARLLGRYWLPWLQPQHLHLAPCHNIVRLLGELGWEVLLADEGGAHDPIDIAAAVALFANRHLPLAKTPWHAAEPARSRQLLRRAGWLAALPLMLAGHVVDRAIVGPLLRTSGQGNAIRIIARRPPQPTSSSAFSNP